MKPTFILLFVGILAGTILASPVNVNRESRASPDIYSGLQLDPLYLKKGGVNGRGRFSFNNKRDVGHSENAIFPNVELPTI